jgi:hypothetical protein
MFRINGFDSVTKSIEFYFKADRESDDKLICNFCVADQGIFYYRKGSKILTGKETDRARYSHDGFISMEDLGELFEELGKAGLSNFEPEVEKQWKITRKGKRVAIELADRDTE